MKICWRCQRDFFPARLRSALRSDMVLRAPTKGMATDSEAEKVRLRKLRKALRQQVRAGDWKGAVVTFRIITAPSEPASEECEACLKLSAA